MHSQKTTFATYIIGFLLSVILTIAAYLFAINHITSRHELFSHEFLIAIFIALAFIQLVVQLLFFLHVGQESKPRWNLVFFVATGGAVLTVVIASLWIMSHLNYNMSPQDMNHIIILEEGIHK